MKSYCGLVLKYLLFLVSEISGQFLKRRVSACSEPVEPASLREKLPSSISTSSTYIACIKLFDKIYNRHHMEIIKDISLSACIDSYHFVYSYVVFRIKRADRFFPFIFPFFGQFDFNAYNMRFRVELPFSCFNYEVYFSA